VDIGFYNELGSHTLACIVNNQFCILSRAEQFIRHNANLSAWS